MGKKAIVEVKKPAGMPMPAVQPFRENGTVPMIHEVRARLAELEVKVTQLERQLGLLDRRIEDLEHN